MEHLAYSFCMSLLHSFWQAGILLTAYIIINYLFKVQQPIAKRNIWYLLLVFQILISIYTFFTYFSGSPIFLNKLLIENYDSSAFSSSYINLIFALYSLIVFYKTTSLFYHWQKFKTSFFKDRQIPSTSLTSFTNNKAKDIGITKLVTVWVTNAIYTPITFGFFKPVILLPIALVNNLTIVEIESLILHELSHIKNKDYLLNWLLIFMESVFFFNPFIKIICNKIKLEREINCDVEVVKNNISPVIYAETLLKAAKLNTNKSHPFQLAAVFTNEQLLKRIHFFTSNKILKNTPYKTKGATYLLLLFILAINILLVGNNNIQSESLLANTIAQKVININNEKLPEVSTIIVSNAPKIKTQKKERTVKVQKKPRISFVPESHTDNIEEEFFPVIPVSYKRIDSTKTLIIKEESPSTGQTIVRVYKLTLKDGEWIKEFLWMMTETKPMKDSTPINAEQ